MNRSRLFSLILLAALLAACGGEATPAPASSALAAPTETAAPTASPTPTGVQAVVVDLINQVDAHATPEAGWSTAEVDMILYTGGQVRAAEESTARLRIADSLVRVAPNTIFTLGQPSEDRLQIDLEQGQIWLNVEGLEQGQQFEVETPGAVAAVRGTRFSVRVTEDQTTVVSVVEGQVDLSGGGQTVTIDAGNVSAVPPGGVPTQPKPLCPVEWLRWGMAHGPNLDLVFPVYAEETTVTYEGDVVDDPPTFSSDGRYLFAYVYEPGQGDSYHSFYDLDAGAAMDAAFPAHTYVYAFNPVDGRLAYWAYDGGYRLCISQADGGEANCFDPGGYFTQLSWSPDGSALLYSLGSGSSSSSPHNLYRRNPDGSGLVQLTQSTSGWNQREAWSPDGSQIAYVNTPNEEAPGSLWVMNADGSGQTMLYENVAGVDRYATFDSAVDWSPDGSQLAVPTPDGDIALVGLDGSPPTIVDTPGSLEDITWSPSASGWPLAFVSHASKDPEDGYGLYLLPAAEAAPAWFSGLQYGPYWSSDGRFLLIGILEPTGSTSPANKTTFVRVRSSPSFWP